MYMYWRTETLKCILTKVFCTAWKWQRLVFRTPGYSQGNANGSLGVIFFELCSFFFQCIVSAENVIAHFFWIFEFLRRSKMNFSCRWHLWNKKPHHWCGCTFGWVPQIPAPFPLPANNHSLLLIFKTLAFPEISIAQIRLKMRNCAKIWGPQRSSIHYPGQSQFENPAPCFSRLGSGVGFFHLTQHQKQCFRKTKSKTWCFPNTLNKVFL